MEDLFRAGAHRHRRPAARARRLRQALRRRRADLACSSCSTRCCRATTRSPSTPTSSSAAPTRSSTCCSGRDVQRAYGKPEQAVLTLPLLAGTDGDEQDVQVAGQPHRGHRAARGDVRQDACASPTRRWRRGTSCCCGASRRPGAGPRDAKRALARGARGALPRRGGRAPRPRRTSTGVFVAHERARRDAGGRASTRRRRRSTCPRCSPRRSASRARRRGARSPRAASARRRAAVAGARRAAERLDGGCCRSASAASPLRRAA